MGWLWKVAVLACVLGLATWLAVDFVFPPTLPDGFPALPDLQTQSSALRNLLADADAKARSHPVSAENIGRLGMIYHANQFYDQASGAYRIASQLAADDYRWPYGLALVEVETGQEKEMPELLKKTIQLKKDYSPALEMLADTYYKQGNLDEAERYYLRSAKTGGKDSELQAVFGLGRVAARRRDWRRVIELIAPLARDYPHVRPPHQLLLDAYEATGDAEKAAEERRALLEPNLIVVPLLKDPLGEELLSLSCSSTRLLKEAGLLSRFRRPDDAIRAARRAAEVAPDDADAHHFLARTLLEAHGGEPEAVDEALTHLREGLRLRPDDLLPLWYFATIFFKQNKTDAAVERLHTLLTENARSAESSYYLGVVAEHRGRIEEAAARYRDALKSNPDNAEAHYKLGLIYVREGNLREATACFQKAVRLKPSFDMARCNLGVALDMQGKTGEAIEQFEAALRFKPNDATTHKFLAIALLKTGKVGQAMQHLRETVRLTPDDEEARRQLELLERKP